MGKQGDLRLEGASCKDACLALGLMDSEDYLLGAQVKRGHKLRKLSVVSVSSVRDKKTLRSLCLERSGR